MDVVVKSNQSITECSWASQRMEGTAFKEDEDTCPRAEGGDGAHETTTAVDVPPGLVY